MKRKIGLGEYRSLAQLRYLIRHFLQEGDATTRAAGLEPQQYLLLLTIRGLPAGQEPTVRTLAERLALRHHSAVELIDRLEMHGYVRRGRDLEDRRQVNVSLTPKGEKILERVVEQRISELRSTGRELVAAVGELLEPATKGGNSAKKK
jgi:DNA-binding MarR family transcriptional regulator